VIDFISQKGRKNVILFMHGFTSGNETWENTQTSVPSLLLEIDEINTNFDAPYISYFSRLIDFRRTRSSFNILKMLFVKNGAYVAKIKVLLHYLILYIRKFS